MIWGTITLIDLKSLKFRQNWIDGLSDSDWPNELEVKLQLHSLYLSDTTIK